MNGLSYMLPFLCTIGPFPLLLNQSPQNNFASLGSNLWKEDPKCLQWLESKESGSVVYVNFGSITVMSAEQLLEFAWGLANNKKPFLEEVEKLVNDLMEGEKGKKMRQKIVELKKKAEEATTPSGCSFMNLDKFIKEEVTAGYMKIIKFANEDLLCSSYTVHLSSSKDITSESFLSHSTHTTLISKYQV
ncbi:hypothetical protein JHK86_034140 [Glycine max]|nr:hypothetical protein JHK86_034140 [Glycine max]